MKKTDFKGKGYSELIEILNDLKKEAFNLRFQTIYGQIMNVSRIRKVKKDIARILTVMNHKKLEVNNVK